MSTFYLVRHAHAGWTPDEDRPLSAQGEKDANRVADILQQCSIGAIYTSPFRRAQQTVETLAARLGLPIHVEQSLQERRLGSPNEGFLEAVEATWQDPSFAHPGGETNADAQRRGLAVLRRLQPQHKADRIVLSTHGNLMALILQIFAPSIDFVFWKSLTIPDIYSVSINIDREATISRVWQ